MDAIASFGLYALVYLVVVVVLLVRLRARGRRIKELESTIEHLRQRGYSRN